MKVKGGCPTGCKRMESLQAVAAFTAFPTTCPTQLAVRASALPGSLSNHHAGASSRLPPHLAPHCASLHYTTQERDRLTIPASKPATPWPRFTKMYNRRSSPGGGKVPGAHAAAQRVDLCVDRQQPRLRRLLQHAAQHGPRARRRGGHPHDAPRVQAGAHGDLDVPTQACGWAPKTSVAKRQRRRCRLGEGRGTRMLGRWQYAARTTAAAA